MPRLAYCFFVGLALVTTGFADPVEIVTSEHITDNAAQPVVAMGRSGRRGVWEEQGALKCQHAGEPPKILAQQGHAAALRVLPDGRVFAAW